MKKILPGFLLFLFIIPLSAQTYILLDSARKIIHTAKTPEQKFRGLRTLDRYCYSTGLVDSSTLLQKEMFAIAKELKRDTLMSVVYRAIGNRYIIKADFNFSLQAYFKALEYADTDVRRAGLYGNIAYVYILTENNEVALNYIKKGEAIGQSGENLYFQNMLFGRVYNNLNKPDSALFYFRQAENVPVKINDALLNSVFMLQTARAYELRDDADLAETWYRKTLAYCKEKNNLFHPKYITGMCIAIFY